MTLFLIYHPHFIFPSPKKQDLSYPLGYPTNGFFASQHTVKFSHPEKIDPSNLVILFKVKKRKIEPKVYLIDKSIKNV